MLSAAFLIGEIKIIIKQRRRCVQDWGTEE